MNEFESVGKCTAIAVLVVFAAVSGSITATSIGSADDVSVRSGSTNVTNTQIQDYDFASTGYHDLPVPQYGEYDDYSFSYQEDGISEVDDVVVELSQVSSDTDIVIYDDGTEVKRVNADTAQTYTISINDSDIVSEYETRVVTYYTDADSINDPDDTVEIQSIQYKGKYDDMPEFSVWEYDAEVPPGGQGTLTVSVADPDAANFGDYENGTYNTTMQVYPSTFDDSVQPTNVSTYNVSVNGGFQDFTFNSSQVSDGGYVTAEIQQGDSLNLLVTVNDSLSTATPTATPTAYQSQSSDGPSGGSIYVDAATDWWWWWFILMLIKLVILWRYYRD